MEVGQHKEKARYRAAEPNKRPREKWLDPFNDVGSVIPLDTGDEIVDPMESNPSFNEVPKNWMHFDAWGQRFARPFRYQGNILILEA
eukprot:2718805-Amphidinium_carterae.1